MAGPFDICLASPGLPHDGGTLDERSLGGSETAAICVSRALADRGHHVTVFSPCQRGGVWDGVEYRPIAEWGPYVTMAPHDVTISSRDFGALAAVIPSHIKVLWCHDLALRRNRDAIAGLLWQLDHLYVLSEFQRQQYATVLQGIPESVFRVTRNGIRVADFPGLSRGARDPHKLLYASRPERGLENALAIMELVGRRNPDIWLGVCGYDNSPPQLAAYYESLWAKARTMPNVRLLGCLPKKQWYHDLETAGALIYPGVAGDFREIFCIVAAEAMAAACPIVTIAKGALPETCGPDAAVYVGDEDTDPHSAFHREAFATAIVELVQDQVRWKALSRAGRKRGLTLDWAGVATQWETWWAEDLEARRTDPQRIMQTMADVGEREGVAWMESRRRTA